MRWVRLYNRLSKKLRQINNEVNLIALILIKFENWNEKEILIGLSLFKPKK